MDFAGQLADLQQSASRTADYAARRAATLRVLAPKAGEAVLDLGCGSGLNAKDVARVAKILERRKRLYFTGRSSLPERRVGATGSKAASDFLDLPIASRRIGVPG